MTSLGCDSDSSDSVQIISTKIVAPLTHRKRSVRVLYDSEDDIRVVSYKEGVRPPQHPRSVANVLKNLETPPQGCPEPWKGVSNADFDCVMCANPLQDNSFWHPSCCNLTYCSDCVCMPLHRFLRERSLLGSAEDRARCLSCPGPWCLKSVQLQLFELQDIGRFSKEEAYILANALAEAAQTSSQK